MKTVVISFRAHKNLKSWLEYAGNAFSSGGELLRLMVSKAAYEQAAESKASRLLDGLIYGKREPLGVGDTAVFAVRLPLPIIELVRESAASRHKSMSEWCSVVLFNWWQDFQELDEESRGKGNASWLADWAEKYRAFVDNLGLVYAETHQKQGAVSVK